MNGNLELRNLDFVRVVRRDFLKSRKAKSETQTNYNQKERPVVSHHHRLNLSIGGLNHNRGERCSGSWCCGYLFARIVV